MAFVTVRSRNAEPRTPAATALWILAVVAALGIPANVALIVSLLPDSVAVPEPEPATVARIAASMGTGVKRILNLSSPCAINSAAARKSLLLVRQCEDIKRISFIRRIDLRRNRI